MGAIRNHYELEVYKMAVEFAMQVFGHSKAFPKEETYSLTDQIRRSSRSVATSIADPWVLRKSAGKLKVTPAYRPTRLPASVL
jgi:hypothetical protein